MDDLGYFSSHLPKFDGKNWDKLVTQMKVYFDAQDVCDMMEFFLKALPKTTKEAPGKSSKKIKRETSILCSLSINVWI